MLSMLIKNPMSHWIIRAQTRATVADYKASMAAPFYRVNIGIKFSDSGGEARQNSEGALGLRAADLFCLDFSLVRFFSSKEKK
jgi:hypothetical protein